MSEAFRNQTRIHKNQIGRKHSKVSQVARAQASPRSLRELKRMHAGESGSGSQPNRKWFPKTPEARKRRRIAALTAASAIAVASIIAPRVAKLFDGSAAEAQSVDGSAKGVKEGKDSKFFYSEIDDKWYYRVEAGDTPEQMTNDTFGTDNIDQNTRDAFVASIGDNFEAGTSIEVPAEVEGLDSYQLPGAPEEDR